MKELSIIISCTNNAQGIKGYIENLQEVFREVNHELIILNISNSPEIMEVLMEEEQKTPENIMLVNCEVEYTDEEMLETGLGYAQSGCFLFVHMGEKLTPELLDSLLYDETLIDEKRFHFLYTKYLYIMKAIDNKNFPYIEKYDRACLDDRDEDAGMIDEHYFFQDVYVAKKVFKSGIEHIYDIGSRLDGYISHLLSMGIKVSMVDIRPLKYRIEGLDFVQGNATELSTLQDESVPYLSSLHALEHFGLGRYGDPIDPDAWRKALAQYGRVLRKGGYLYLSVPVGNIERVEFNAHRVFAPQSIIDQVAEKLRIEEFTFFHKGEKTTYDMSNAVPNEIREVLEYTSKYMLGAYDCGVFVFKKE